MSLKLSIITPSLNASRYIEDAILSVLNQGYEHVEHIIIDGGSRDGTLDILKKYPHLIWISESDRGQSHAMNKGFRMATGDIIGYLNSDDYYLPGAFQAIIPYFEHDTKFIVGQIRVVLDDGSFWINNARVGHRDMLRHWEPEAYCVNSAGYFYRREIQESIGGFSETNRLTMDLEFLLEASLSVEFTKIDALLGVFRYIQGTITSKSQSSPSMWTPKTFAFIDRFLKNLSEEELKEYQMQRKHGYLIRREWQTEEKIRQLHHHRSSIPPNHFGAIIKDYLREMKLKSVLKKIKGHLAGGSDPW